jgi:hypothetical protein
VKTIPTTEEEVSKIQPLEIEPHIKLVGKEVRIVELEVGIEPLVAKQVKTTKSIVEEINA